MSKHIDLADRITERLDVPCGNIRLGIHEALAYLDRYPDQAPGLTMTESELYAAANVAGDSGEFDVEEFAKQVGIAVTPAQEPTNAEKATADLEAWGMLRSGALELGPWLAGQGWTKAPGGESDD